MLAITSVCVCGVSLRRGRHRRVGVRSCVLPSARRPDDWWRAVAPRTAAAVPLLIDTPARTAALARPASSPALGTQPGLQTSTLLCLVLAAGYRLRTTAPTHQHCPQQCWPWSLGSLYPHSADHCPGLSCHLSVLKHTKTTLTLRSESVVPGLLHRALAMTSGLQFQLLQQVEATVWRAAPQ